MGEGDCINKGCCGRKPSFAVASSSSCLLPESMFCIHFFFKSLQVNDVKLCKYYLNKYVSKFLLCKCVSKFLLKKSYMSEYRISNFENWYWVVKIFRFYYTKRAKVRGEACFTRGQFMAPLKPPSHHRIEEALQLGPFLAHNKNSRFAELWSIYYAFTGYLNFSYFY